MVFFRYLGTNTPTDIHFYDAGSLHVVLVAEDVVCALGIMQPTTEAKEGMVCRRVMFSF